MRAYRRESFIRDSLRVKDSLDYSGVLNLHKSAGRG
jgi:hypothetical protein